MLGFEDQGLNWIRKFGPWWALLWGRSLGQGEGLTAFLEEGQGCLSRKCGPCMSSLLHAIICVWSCFYYWILNL